MAEARAHHRAGDLRTAMSLYEATLADAPLRHDVLKLLGILSCQVGALHDGERLLTGSIRIRQNDAGALAIRGAVRLVLDRVDDALDDLDSAVRLQRDHVDAHFARADALGRAGLWAEALLSYERVLVLAPERADAWLEKGNGLAALGLIDQAVDSYHQALRRQPDFAEAWLALAGAYLQLDHVDEATRCFRRGITLELDRGGDRPRLPPRLARQLSQALD